MISVIVIAFEVVSVFFLAIFVRTNDTTSLSTTYFTLLSDSLALMLAFTLMYAPFRKLSIISLLTLLTILGITLQTSLLFTTFWSSCFNGFNANFQLSS